MGFYADVIFPRICNVMMSSEKINGKRKEVLANVSGKILEIGFGTGLTLPHYPEHVRAITSVDVNPGMNALARKRIRQSPIQVEQLLLSGEQLPMEDGMFDSVVSTWTLCSIPDVEQALREIRRVLKPIGQFHFIEHGLSPDPGVRRWQHWLNPINKRLGVGCHLDRNIRELIRAQGFQFVELKEYYLEKEPKPMAYMYQGIAARAA
jgi:ubiquinone/menaquinone biosynthesis C-methylase UbiE